MEKDMFSINENEYTQMTDEKLIENIKNDDHVALDCLMKRYNDIVNMKANKFFMIGDRISDTKSIIKITWITIKCIKYLTCSTAI